MVRCGRTCGWRRKLEETHMRLIPDACAKIFVHFTSGVTCRVGKCGWMTIREVSKLNLESEYFKNHYFSWYRINNSLYICSAFKGYLGKRVQICAGKIIHSFANKRTPRRCVTRNSAKSVLLILKKIKYATRSLKGWRVYSLKIIIFYEFYEYYMYEFI